MATSPSIHSIEHFFPSASNGGRRLFPRAFVKSALFNVGGKGPREQLINTVIASMPDAQIEYNGTELRDDDEDVLMALIYLAGNYKVNGDGSSIELSFTGYSMLQELEWPNTTKYYKKLRECLDRLQGGSIRVFHNAAGSKIRFKGQMVRKFFEVENPGSRPVWKVWLEPEIVSLIRSNQQSPFEIEWTARKRLSRPMAKFLHRLMAEHDPKTVFIADEKLLMTLAGSKAAEMRTFRDTLRSALKDMVVEQIVVEWALHQGYLYATLQPGVKIVRSAAAARSQLSLDFQTGVMTT